jgi:hypothetical protein
MGRKVSDTVLITVEIPEQLWEDALKFGVDMNEVAKDVSDFAVLYLISLISMRDNYDWEKANKSKS